MKYSLRFWLSILTASLWMLSVGAEEASGPTSLLKRAASVDEPIPETYEPLNSTYVGDGEQLDNSIEQSWQLKQEAAERKAPSKTSSSTTRSSQTSQSDSPDREALEARIEEPGIGPVLEEEPVIIDTGDSLQIRGE